MKVNELEILARRRAEEKIAFYTHLVIYVVVNVFLVIIWYTFSRNGFPWFIFPIFGWGIGISAHFLQAFSSSLVHKMAKKEYEKLKK